MASTPANGIQVPERYQSEFNRVKPHDIQRPEYRRACIRDYVREHKGEIMTLIDFGKAAYGNPKAGAACHLISKLLKEKRLTRSKIKVGKSKGYTYLWHDVRPVKQDVHGPVITTKLDIPEVDLAADVLAKIDELVLVYSQDIDTDSYITGAVRFRNWIHERVSKQLQKRKEILSNV